MGIGVFQIEVEAKVTPFNRLEVASSMEALGGLFADFGKCKNQEEIGCHISRINGYIAALVNMGVIDEDDANGKLREATLLAAAARDRAIEEGQKDGNKKDNRKREQQKV